MKIDSPYFKSALEILKKSYLFGALREQELETILSLGRYLSCAKGETIENDEGTEYLNIVIEGEVKISHEIVEAAQREI
ncbi:MAG: hypothetical protein L3J42_01915 [Hydrogenimonas sp.]|nr:hypothetical protein [Hydrogenimonas sp.]